MNQNKFDDCEILKKILPWDDKDTVWESRTFVSTPAIQKTQTQKFNNSGIQLFST